MPFVCLQLYKSSLSSGQLTRSHQLASKSQQQPSVTVALLGCEEGGSWFKLPGVQGEGVPKYL